MPLGRRKPWFAVKRFGYGVGLPISWEGWLLITLFVATITVLGLVLSPLLFVLSVIPATAALLLIAHRQSDDDWRYRNGG